MAAVPCLVLRYADRQVVVLNELIHGHAPIATTGVVQGMLR